MPRTPLLVLLLCGLCQNLAAEPLSLSLDGTPGTAVTADDPGLTLALRHSNPVRYTTAQGAGKLFLEGVQSNGWKFGHPQHVWCRKWNPESHEPGPVIESHGATIWTLGFKTEYLSSKVWAFDGAKTEILGGFIYPVNDDIPKDRPVFRNVDSDFSGIWGMSVYVANHHLQVDDTHQGRQVLTTVESGQWVYARYRMDLYTSRRR